MELDLQSIVVVFFWAMRKVIIKKENEITLYLMRYANLDMKF